MADPTIILDAPDWSGLIEQETIRPRRPYPQEVTITDLVDMGWSEGRARGYMARSIRAGTAAWEWALDDNGKKVKVYRRLAQVPALPSAPGSNGTDERRDGDGVLKPRVSKKGKGTKAP